MTSDWFEYYHGNNWAYQDLDVQKIYFASSERFQALRKASDQRHMESEDAAEGERKEAEMKVESLTSIVKMFELKAKNSQEQSECNAIILLYRGPLISLQNVVKKDLDKARQSS